MHPLGPFTKKTSWDFTHKPSSHHSIIFSFLSRGSHAIVIIQAITTRITEGLRQWTKDVYQARQVEMMLCFVFYFFLNTSVLVSFFFLSSHSWVKAYAFKELPIITKFLPKDHNQDSVKAAV